MSKELVFCMPGAAGAFRDAHHFAINNSTFINVQGNFVRYHFAASVYHRWYDFNGQIHAQNYHEAPKAGPSLHRVLKPEFMHEYNRALSREYQAQCH